VTLSTVATGVRFDVRVAPNAPRSRLELDAQGGLKARIDAPPVDGEANERLVRWFAREVFGIPLRSVRVVAGQRGRAKTIEVDLDEASVRVALQAALDAAAR
jgi:uncharacterized protein (TIGR00251 family)